MSYPGGYGQAEYLEYCLRRKDQIIKLCAALTDYLMDNIDSAIAGAKRPVPRPPRPTIEDLNQAQNDLDMAQGQLDALERLTENMPKDIRDAYIGSQRPSIDRVLQHMQERVSVIQKAMEEPEPDPSSPWDGSHQIGTLCAICARPSKSIESSIPRLVIALKAEGWGRDSAGDHICPDCAARMNVQAPEADGVRVSPTPKDS